jgi:hypothetical protein
VLDFFDRVDAATATAVLQRWRRDPGYLDSIRRIELIGGDVPPKTG